LFEDEDAGKKGAFADDDYRMTVQKREPHKKRMMWFRGQYVPILYDISGPYRGFGSKDWVPRSYLQRVVAFMFGTIFVVGGAGAMACTVFIKTDLIATLHSEAAAMIFGFFLVCVVLTGSVIVIALGIRLLRCVFRSDQSL
jgi:hypothetical protein